MQIPTRIQRAKPMRIHADPDLNMDPGQTLPSQKAAFLHENYTFGSMRAKSMQIQVRIHNNGKSTGKSIKRKGIF
jgi:hypothetical protein